MPLDDTSITLGTLALIVIFILGLSIGSRLETKIETWWDNRKKK